MFALSILPTVAQREFAARVIDGTRRLFEDTAVVSSYGDGSESPNGERYAAVRDDDVIRIVFDFREGRCYTFYINEDGTVV